MNAQSARSVATVAALIAGGAALSRSVFLGYPRARLRPGALLSRKEQAIVAAAADAFFPPTGPIPLSGTEAGLVGYMNDYISKMPPTQQRLTRLLLLFIEHAPTVFGPRRARFSSLCLEDRLATLERMRTSPLYFRRICFLSMRTMLTMGYLAHPEVARHVGSTPNPDPFGLEDLAPEAGRLEIAS